MNSSTIPIPGYAQRLTRVIERLHHEFPGRSVDAIQLCVASSRKAIVEEELHFADYGNYARHVEETARRLLTRS